MAISLDPEAIVFPEGSTATSNTANLCPTNLNGLNYGLKFQIVTVQSSEEEIAYFLS